MEKTKLPKRNDINHIMRNGLVDIVYKVRGIARNVDDILNRCREMEDALKEMDEEENKGRSVVVDLRYEPASI